MIDFFRIRIIDLCLIIENLATLTCFCPNLFTYNLCSKNNYAFCIMRFA